ncbi:MAG: hypothetical protein ACLVJ6_12640 [Merdibacter sp.]
MPRAWHASAAAERAVAGLDSNGGALGFSDLRDDGFSVALLSASGQVPRRSPRFPVVGVSLPRHGFSKFADMLAEAQQAFSAAFGLLRANQPPGFNPIARHYGRCRRRSGRSFFHEQGAPLQHFPEARLAPS